jgi:hypothetical protein
MKSVLIRGFFCVFLLASACNKKEDAAQQITPPSVIANADNTIRENVRGDIDPSLTAQLRAYIQKKGKMPADFGEFRRDGLDSLPQPPEGKKWVIDTTSQSVKAVAK